MQRVTIVNKFGPASNAITGQSAKELADHLSSHGIEVNFISLKASYQAAKTESDIKLSYAIKELKSLYAGKSPLLRFGAGILDGFRLWLASTTVKSEVTIVMTDPPLLFMWFQLFRVFSRKKLYYWTMDLYPEAFVAGNYISKSNVIYRLFYFIVYRKIPDLTIALGEQQYQYLRSRFGKEFPYQIVPCGIIERKTQEAASYSVREKIRFGYGGNIGEAHDANFLITLIKELDPHKHEIILSIYGSKSQFVKEQIMSYPVVQFRDFLNKDDIASMDINVATLLPEWHQVCVPSKTVTAICCGTPVLLNVASTADNWTMFREAGWLIEPGTDYTVEIRKFLDTITPQEIQRKKEEAKRLAGSVARDNRSAFDHLVKAIQLIPSHG